MRSSETRLGLSGKITGVAANVVAFGLAAITGLVVAYLASCTVGVPVFQPEVEHVDALGVSTKAVEILALLCALRLGRMPGGLGSPLIQEVPR